MMRRKPRPRDRPVTCRQCRKFTRCMEASRMYPCQEFERWEQMSDRELMAALAEAALICAAMAAVYIWMEISASPMRTAAGGGTVRRLEV